MAKNENQEITEEKLNNKQQMLKKHNSLKIFVFLFVLCVLGVAGTTFYILDRFKMQDTDNLQQMQQVYEEKVQNLNNRLHMLEQEINNLKNRPAKVSGISENELNQRLAALQNEWQSDLNKKQSEISANPVPYKQPQEVLLASGAMIIGNLAENGEPVIYETEVLHILAQGNEPALKYVEDMQKYAVSGISGKQELISSFNKIFAELNNVSETEYPQETSSLSKDSTWYDKTITWFKKLFISKKGSKKPVFNPQNDTVWSLVNDGHLQEALNTLKTDDKYVRLHTPALQEWIKQTESYLAFKHAASALLMNALANLHLKEFEH